MTITERIAAAIKPILDEDRRADRERIAALERTIGFLNLRVSNEEERANGWQAMVADLNKQIDALNEECAALVVENKRLAADNNRLNKSLGVNDPFVGMTGPIVEMRQTIKDLKAQLERQPLRIDPDMSDPQPGKLLVVRLDAQDGRALKADMHPAMTLGFFRRQFVGFLVETTAVEVEEQGPWVVWDEADNLQINPCMGRHGWGKVSEGIGPFDARSDAVAALNGWVMGGYSKAPRVITLAEARAIEAKR